MRQPGPAIARCAAMDGIDRAALEARWLALTRRTLPALAARGWPIRADHCFMRVLLDHAHHGRWTDHVAKRPAYAYAAPAALARAVALGEAVAAGTADLTALNRQSLAWRGKLTSAG
ncbi:MAG: GCN5-related N-acetyltransferase [Sphingomonas fennica]